MSDAARCRPTPPARLAVARAALFGALDRAVDLAAALEVRGYAAAGRPPRSSRPWSRHDLSTATAAGSVALVAVVLKAVGVGAVTTYPRLELALGAPELVLVAALLGGASLPFAGRSARLGVAR